MPGPCHLIVTIRKFTITPVQFLPLLNEHATCAASPFEGISCVHSTHNRVRGKRIVCFGGYQDSPGDRPPAPQRQLEGLSFLGLAR